MEKVISKSEVEFYLNLLPKLNEEIKTFKDKWNTFYFTWISPFQIFYVSKQDFLFFANEFKDSKIENKEKLISLEIGQEYEARVILRTEIDFEIYEKYVLKKNN